MKLRIFPILPLCLFVLAFCLAKPTPAANLLLQKNQNQAVLSWPDQGAGKTYTIQRTEDLNRSYWAPPLPWDNWPIPGTSYSEPLLEDGSLFYRLAISERGRVVSVDHQEYYSSLILNLVVIPTIETQYGIDIPFTAGHGVDIYRVEYETVDGLLGPTRATGALFIPRDMTAAADLLSYQHGTIHKRDDAPSNPGVDERYVGLIMAADGYVVAMPDYLNLGPGSTGLHPYVHRRSSATAVVDMVRAVRSVAATDSMIRQELPQGLSDKLFLFGYSQGAYVTLAAQQEMEQKHAAEFTITASAPSDGPYDLSGTMADIMTSDQPYSSPNYLPYVLLSYNTIYHLFEDPAEVMLEPYASLLPPAFDGEHSGGQIDDLMPSSMIPGDILRPEFREAFATDPDHPFRQILRDNDLLNWAPVTPTTLFHCAADEVVPFANAQVAYTSFLEAGADPTKVFLVDPNPNGLHGTCLFSGVPLIITWFESMR